MTRRSICFLVGLALVGAGACTVSQTDPRGDAFPTVDPGTSRDEASTEPTADANDAGALDAAAMPDGQCASTFGSSLTPGFGRLDGIVYAVQKPSDKGCAFPNNTHVILQVLMNGAVHRVAIALSSTRAGTDPRMRQRTFPSLLLGPPYSEGWHTNVKLDYVQNLALRNDEDGGFVPITKEDLIAELEKELVIGSKVSVYSTSDKGRPDSAHLVHRNKTDEDGALVVDATSYRPRYFLFHFDGQTFSLP